MQDTLQFKAGDKVRHEKRPEWGVGEIQRAENIKIGMKPAQRLMIRFPNVGLKTLSTLGAELVTIETASSQSNNNTNTLVEHESASESGWLGDISKQKPEDVMAQLPQDATDPFTPLKSRLEVTLNLYRFKSDGRGLIDWAVARTGLDDPMSRFTRHELEEFFQKWAFLRQKHLAKLLEGAKDQPGLVETLLKNTTIEAQQAVAKYNTAR